MRPLIGLVRYFWSDLLRSQRFLLPVFLYVLLLAPLFNGDPGPPPQLWVVTAVVLYPVSCWLAVTVANTEDPVQRHVTIAAAGGPGRVAAGVALTCLLADLVLVAIAVGWPMLSTDYAFPAHAVAAGVFANVGVAATGTAVGLLCARPVLHSAGWSALAGGGALFVTGATPWLPPVGLAFRQLSSEPVPTLGLALQAALGLALAGLAVGATVLAHNRR
jgi:hypothetical protein